MLEYPTRLALALALVLVVALRGCSKEEPPRRDSSAVSEALKGQIDAALVKKGGELFLSKKCFACHKIGGDTKLLGPNLAGIAQRMDVETMETWIRHPKQLKPKTLLPAFDGSDDQLIALIAWLRTL